MTGLKIVMYLLYIAAEFFNRKSVCLRFVFLTIERRFPRGIKIVPAKLHETVVIGQVDDITDEGALNAEHVLACPRLEQVETHSGGRV